MVKRGFYAYSLLARLPLLGNVLELRSQRLALLERVSREFGDIGAFHFGPRKVPLLNSPELVREALVNQSAMFEKTATVRLLATPVLGKSVFLSEGEEHRQQRKLLAPLFQQRQIQHYVQVVTDYTERWQGLWRGGETINLADEMTRLTLWIISKVLLVQMWLERNTRWARR